MREIPKNYMTPYMECSNDLVNFTVHAKCQIFTDTQIDLLEKMFYEVIAPMKKYNGGDRNSTTIVPDDTRAEGDRWPR